MSTKYLFRALKAEVGNPQRKLVLIMLADIANEKGQCWPSHQYLAERAECSRRSVINHLSALEKSGHIKITNRSEKGIKASNIYTIHDVQNLHNDVQNLHGGSAAFAQGGSAAFAHNTPTIDTPNDTPIEDGGFEDFWQAYPKKVDKDAARKAWGKLKPSPDLISKILSDIAARLELGEWMTDHRKQYIPGPAPYLNNKKWNNEIIPREDFKPKTDYSKLALDADDVVIR